MKMKEKDVLGWQGHRKKNTRVNSIEMFRSDILRLKDLQLAIFGSKYYYLNLILLGFKASINEKRVGDESI